MLLSCAGLKPAQLNAVEKYTTATKAITTVPPDMYFRVYQLRSQAQSVQLSGVIATNQSAKESVGMLKADFDDKVKFLNLVDSFSYAYKIVGKYAEMVSALISEKHLKEFTKNKKEWQSSFDGLITRYNSSCTKRVPAATPIPSSVGAIVANVIKQLGSAKIKKLQKKYLLAAIQTARNPFEGICSDFLNNDIPKITKELGQLPIFIDENYKDFLNNLKAYETKQGNNAYNYYKLYLPIYANWQIQLKELNTLVTKLQTSINSLKNGYGVMENYISNTNKKSAMPPELLQLDIDYISLLETIARFTSAREKLFTISY
jgi:hypothetical protein